jgi:vancomycin resistance protein VanJ
MSTEQPDCPAIRVRFFVAAARLFSLTACVGIIVRMAVQDRYPVLAVVFYMFSPASICGCAGLAALLFRVGQNRKGAGRMMLVAVACAVWCVTAMFHFHAQADRTAETVRIVFWNVYRGPFGWNSILHSIHEEDADVVVLAEVGTKRLPSDFLERSFPNHPHRLLLPREMAVVSKHPVHESETIHHSARGLYHRVVLSIGGQDVSLIVCDLPSRPYYQRADSIQRVTRIAAEISGQPSLIVGDMNTPVDSVHFDRIRTMYQNAFAVGGHGYHATWPMPLPVIAIDHCWVSRHIEVAACRIKWTLSSDHRPLVADLVIGGAEAREAR